MNCETCEWYRYPMMTDNSLTTKPIPTIITDLRRCERGWCDREGLSMDDLISRQAAIDAILEDKICDNSLKIMTAIGDGDKAETLNMTCDRHAKMLMGLPSAQPVTAKRIVGKSRDGMTLWYQCDMCNEPVDAQDSFCRGCGRRLIDERSD